MGNHKATYREVNMESVLAGINPKTNSEATDTLLDVVNLQTDTLHKKYKTAAGRVMASFNEVPYYRRIQIPENNPNALKCLKTDLRTKAKRR